MSAARCAPSFGSRLWTVRPCGLRLDWPARRDRGPWRRPAGRQGGRVPMPALPARLALMVMVALAVAAVPDDEAEGVGTTLRDGFEGRRPSWRQEQADATVNLLDHDRSDRAAHEGNASERIH